MILCFFNVINCEVLACSTYPVVRVIQYSLYPLLIRTCVFFFIQPAVSDTVGFVCVRRGSIPNRAVMLYTKLWLFQVSLLSTQTSICKTYRYTFNSPSSHKACNHITTRNKKTINVLKQIVYLILGKSISWNTLVQIKRTLARRLILPL